MPSKTFIPEEMGAVSRIQTAPKGLSEFDRRLLTEGWKIGQSSKTFIPEEMGAVSRIQTSPKGLSEFDRRLLTEGWKIGQSSKTFIPEEMGAVSRIQTSPKGLSEFDQRLLTQGWKIGQPSASFLTEQQPRTFAAVKVASAQEVVTPSGMKSYVTNDLGEAMRIQAEVKSKIAEQ
jgi:hypothetical protein